MLSSDHSQFHSSPPIMDKHHPFRPKTSSFFTDGFLFMAGASAAFLLVWSFYSLLNPSFSNPNNTFINIPPQQVQDQTIHCTAATSPNMARDPPDLTFYDDPEMNYSVGSNISNWDEKRKEWMAHHPSFATGAEERIILVTGSQPGPCKNPIGDHLLLRFFKNKVDYCRIHGYDIFYNNVLLHPEMTTFWAKIPVVRAAMLAHPETEWIYWVDSDALLTDMGFKLPLHKYKDFNFVAHGWLPLLEENKSWTGLNAGVFLIRNCQWSMDFMEEWAKMGPQSPDYEKWSEIQRTLFKDKLFPGSDDQAGLIYLIVEEKEKWADKIYLEHDFYFEGYWLEVVAALDNVSTAYVEMERANGVRRLGRRHAEKVSEYYGAQWAEYLEEAGIGYGIGSVSRPFITHFTGCQPCSGNHNEIYSGKSCWDGMQKALTFADNQVLRNFGFVHPRLQDSSTVKPLPFNYPSGSDGQK